MVHRTSTSLSVLVAAALLIGGCGTSETTHVPDPVPGEQNLFDGLVFGSADAFDIVTWNLENFPANDANPPLSVKYAAHAVRAMDADLIALQEIVSGTSFAALLDSLPGWSGYRAVGAPYDQNLAYLWREATVSVAVDPYTIYNGEYSAFPRRPLVLECSFAGQTLVIVNNHLKCCGDNVIDEEDEDDEEYRRRLAVGLLDTWIRVEHPGDAVIVLGDLNDRLTDAPAANVFSVLLDAPGDYLFTDMSLAEGSSINWSFKYSSHIDHILVTDELFGHLAHAAAEVRTFHMDSYLESGWGEYETNLSDHLPVGLKLPLAP
ncbi:endonuclease/exonuclease/phosphatase family protein [bacterium]|nr:endonuclease/exonuclease/phosphatase family protein [bacterium]MBU1073823.1 endonuclease/exonuclease/phosphatase family protein [bacterium]MBU1674424.1 endonuclease/exonuclease/phosphatase family protein [bacterium]